MHFDRRTLAVCLFAAAVIAPSAALAQDAKPGACTAKVKSGASVKVKLSTTQGPIVIELDARKAPISSENFANYVDAGHYAGTVFHRVIDNFMIQGGGFTKDMAQKPTRNAIRNEGTNGLKNDAYTIAMARTPNPDSATAQFFINVKDNDALNAGAQGAGYAVFGKVVDGKDTVDKIKKLPVGNAGGHQNVPTTPVVIEKAECL
jgi:cyclophilin family peptidyl-prolyl cis-trans isomerase